MELADFTLLEALVKHGSISKASETLNLAQPTISKRLSRLEYVLGTALFERTSAGLIATAHTDFILAKSRAIGAEVAAIERHIKLMNELRAGELNIGVGPIIEQLYFPEVLLKLLPSECSDLNVDIHTGSADELKALLHDGLIDIAIGPFDRDEHGSDFLTLGVASQPLLIAVRADHPLSDRYRAGTLDFQCLQQYTRISPPVPPYMAKRYPLMQKQRSRIHCNNYSVIKRVLQQSEHFSIGPAAVFSDDVKRGELALMPLPVAIEWQASCLIRPESVSLPVIQKVIQCFQDHPLAEYTQ